MKANPKQESQTISGLSAKESIKVAFSGLLERTTLNRITVIRICERANVTRQTFYYYYHDIIDILKDILFEEIQMEVSRGRSYDTWKHGFRTTLHYLKDHRKAFVNIYRSSYWEEVNSYFTGLSNSLLSGVIDELIQKHGYKIGVDDREFILKFYRIIFNGLMLEWLQSGMLEEPEQLLSNLEKMIDGSLTRGLLRFSQNPYKKE